MQFPEHLDEGTIHAWLDGQLSPDEASHVERHAAECAACSEMVAEARGLIAGASRIAAALDDVPAVMPARPAPVAGAPIAISEARARRTPRRWMIPSAVAATALIAAMSVLSVRNDRMSDAVMSSVDSVADAPQEKREEIRALTSPSIARQATPGVDGSVANSAPGRPLPPLVAPTPKELAVQSDARRAATTSSEQTAVAAASPRPSPAPPPSSIAQTDVAPSVVARAPAAVVRSDSANRLSARPLDLQSVVVTSVGTEAAKARSDSSGRNTAVIGGAAGSSRQDAAGVRAERSRVSEAASADVDAVTRASRAVGFGSPSNVLAPSCFTVERGFAGAPPRFMLDTVALSESGARGERRYQLRETIGGRALGSWAPISAGSVTIGLSVPDPRVATLAMPVLGATTRIALAVGGGEMEARRDFSPSRVPPASDTLLVRRVDCATGGR